MLHTFEPGGYRFLQGGFPYSAGVIAQPGFALRRVRFARPLPVMAAFDAIAAQLQAAGRPLHALCAAELRSPQPFTLAGFKDFNRGYVAVLERWGLFRDGLNPVARSNVCPRFDAPAEPVFHAFSYTVPDTAAGAADFVVAGSGEWPEDQPFPEGIVARGKADVGDKTMVDAWVPAVAAAREAAASGASPAATLRAAAAAQDGGTLGGSFIGSRRRHAIGPEHASRQSLAHSALAPHVRSAQ